MGALPVTSFFAGVLSFLGVYLSVQVILMRRQKRVSHGSGGDKELERSMRAFGNFIEYTPFTLLLMALCESNGAASWVLIALGVLLAAGRLLHAYAIPRSNFKLRFWAMSLTFAVILSLAILLIFQAFTR